MMKKFFENIDKAAAKGNVFGDASLFIVLCTLVVAGTIAAFGLAFIIVAFIKFPLATFGVFFLICLIRLIYAGVTGK
jgi:hypothetical protein